MKKTYMTPEMEVMNIETTVEMMAARPNLGFNDGEVDTEGDQHAGDRRGTWGNLWN